MEDTAHVSWFLAANTANGFYSLYDELEQPGAASKIWYIKGGPGNGKSTFMRRVAGAAEGLGCHVEYVFCSGDPLSLDGILIRETDTSYVDATAPHVQEPSLPGVSGRYLDLSQFYKKTGALNSREILTLRDAYREQYKRAYELLAAAGKADPSSSYTPEEHDSLSYAGHETALGLLPAGGSYRTLRRFISANSCQGFISLTQTACAFGKIYLIHGDKADAWLAGVLDACAERSQLHILCPDPLLPEKADGVIVPGAGVSFLKAHKGIRYPAKNAVHIRIETAASEIDQEYKHEKSLCSALLRQAYTHLKKAKELHDGLEACSRPALDFKALDRFTTAHIRDQFGSGAGNKPIQRQ